MKAGSPPPLQQVGSRGAPFDGLKRERERERERERRGSTPAGEDMRETMSERLSLSRRCTRVRRGQRPGRSARGVVVREAQSAKNNNTAVGAGKKSLTWKDGCWETTARGGELLSLSSSSSSSSSSLPLSETKNL